MAETAAVNDAYQVKIIGSLEGQQTNNILHFVCVGADDDVETHLILVIIACFVTHLLPVLTDGWALEQVSWKRVSPTLGPENVTVVTAGVGAAEGDHLPSFTSAVLSIRTIGAGRAGRGRIFLPCVPEEAVDGSKLDTGHDYWAALLAFAQCFVTNFVHIDPAGGTDIWDMAVYSRTVGGASLPFGASGFSAMRSITPLQYVGTTRSRKVGRGI